MGRATGAAGEPYQQYTGQRVAGLTGDQNAAYDIVRGSAAGAASPWMQGATDYYNQAGDASSLSGGAGDFFNQAGNASGLSGGAGQFIDAAGNASTVDNINSGAAGAGMFGDASGLFHQGAGVDSASMYQPYGQQAAGAAQGALGQANPYIQQSTSALGLSAASPYLGQAAQTFPGAAQDYMNPYNEQVTDRIAQLGARNLSENLLPQISDQFVRAGQYGSPQQRDLIGRSIRDTQDSILGQQAQVLQQGYGTAGQLFGQDQSRLAGLAGTAGGLGTSQQQILQGAGGQLGNLGLSQAGLLSNIGSTGAGFAGADASRMLSAGQGLAGIGQSQIQAAQADASRQAQSAQADYARRLQAGMGIAGINQADYSRMLQAGQGISSANQADYGRMLGAGQGMQSLAQQGQNMSLQNAAALEGVGAAQQGQQQRNLDTAYGDFQDQRNYPWQQIGNLSNVVQGLPINQSSSSTVNSSTSGGSPLSQVAGVGLGVAGLANSGIFKAAGGAVRAGKQVKYKRNHSYGNTPRRGLSLSDAA